MFGIEQLTKEVKGLKATLTEDTRSEKKRLQDKLDSLKVQNEDQEKLLRETKHSIGLERKRHDLEVEYAKKEASLTVREENLKADRKRFEDTIKATEQRFADQINAQKELMKNLMNRLPTFSVVRSEKRIEQVGSGN